MKKIITGIGLLLILTTAHAQKIHLTLFGGISNYQGDMQSKRFTLQQAHAAAGAGILYELTDKLYARANFTLGKISGDDAISGVDPRRNQRFSSPISDLHLGLEYDLVNLYTYRLTPFVFAGMSFFHFNPSTIDSAGNKVFLQPLGTEGQGFFLGRKKYSLYGSAITFGGGLKFALTNNVRLRVEVGLRKTGTDYLDDISTTYADEELLAQNNGPLAASLAFRGDENLNLPYPETNSIRGGPNSKDWYYFTGIGLSFRLFPDNDGRQHRSSTGCPVNIY